MLPKKPPRVGQVGFVYAPPYRIQGVSVAGEQTMVQVAELDVAFDIGLCPRIALSSRIVALSHGHMDHLGGLPYYFSQRSFLGMGVGKCVCHAEIAPALAQMMESWVDLEQQRTPHEIVPMNPGDEIVVKNNIFLRAVEVSHTVPSLGFVLIEHRSKLKPEYQDLPQTRLRELKAEGHEITRMREIPLVAYTGDTELCPGLLSDDFRRAKVVISECTFFEPQHQDRAKTGKHLHEEQLAALLDAWEAQAVVLIHVSRRTNLGYAKEQLVLRHGESVLERIHFLMDHRANHWRYERQKEAVATPPG